MNTSSAVTDLSVGIKTRTTYDQKTKIEEDRELVPENFIDILKKKSSLVGVEDYKEKLKFSLHIQKAYLDIQDVFNGGSKVIMEIVASVPDVKIIFLPNEDNIHKYEQDEEFDTILGGITFAKSETIIVAAKGYDNAESAESYRKFLGVIIHEFCHFAVHETFGNGFKPYYAHDEVAAAKWKELVDQYQSSDLDKFSVIRELFDYEENKWVDELVVRYPQMFVEHYGSEFLHKFEEHFIDLHSIYLKNVYKEFKSEKEKIASLRSVNDISLFSIEQSKLNVKILVQNFEMDFNAYRQVVKTNQTYLVMKNIFDKFNRNCKSTFMYIKINFFKFDENFKLLEKAMQCKKITNLVIDGHDDAFDDQMVAKKVLNLFNSNHVGRITLILHESQNFVLKDGVVEQKQIKFEASHLSNEYKGSLKINFQGSNRELGSLIDINKLVYFDELFNEKIYELFTKKTFSIGNQIKFETLSYLRGNYQHKVSDTWEILNLNENDILLEIFDNNSNIIIECLPSLRIISEMLRMCGRLKHVYPNHWIVNDELFSYYLSELQDYESNYSEYLSKKVLKLDSLEQEVFYKLFEDGKVILMFELINEKDRYNIEKFSNNFKTLKNKICIFTKSGKSEFMRQGKMINLSSIEAFKSYIENDLWHNEKKGQQNDKLLTAREFSREMFDIGQLLFTDDENLEKKSRLNHEALVNLKMKKLNKSVEMMDKAIKFESNSEFSITHNILSVNLWGNFLLHQKKYPEALEKFDEQLSFEVVQDMKNNTFLNKAICLYKLGKNNESVKLIDEVLRALEASSNSKYAKAQEEKAHRIKGFILSEQEKHSQALKSFNKAHKISEIENNLDQENFYLLNQSNSYFALGNNDEFIELASKVLKTERNTKTSRVLQLKSLNLCGDIFKEQKQYSAAIEKYENAASLCTSEMNDKKKMYLNNAADCYHDVKKYDKSVELIESALKIECDTEAANVENSRSMNQWGLVLKDQKFYSAAIEKFENAAYMCTDEMNDQKKIYLNNVADCYCDLKNFDKTVKLIETALNLESKTKAATIQDARSLSQWGLVLEDHNNYSAAIEKYEKAANMFTDEMKDKKKMNFINTASCHRILKNFDKAIELTEAALNIEPNNEAANVQNVRCINLMGRVRKDQKNFLAAIEKFENAARLCTDEMNDKKKLYLNNAADCHRILKNFEEAIELINESSSIESNTDAANVQNARSMHLWGDVMKYQKNYSVAIEKYENAVKLCTDQMNDKKKIYLINAADCYHTLKNYDKTIELIEAELKIESDTENGAIKNASFMNIRKLIQEDQKNYLVAFGNCEKISKLYTNKNEMYKIRKVLEVESIPETSNVQHASFMNLWGLLLIDQQNYSNAIEKFENAAHMCSNGMNDEKKIYLNNAAYCYYDMKNYDKAIELIEEALTIKSNTETANEQNTFSVNLWGHVLKDQKNYSAAIKKFENAAKLCTDEMSDMKKICLNDQVDCFRILKNFEKAIKLIKTVLDINSDTDTANVHNAYFMNVWGIVLYEQKNYSAAIEKHEFSFNMCVAEMSDIAKAYLNNQGYCHYKLKHFEKAIELIETALKIESDIETANEQNAFSLDLWGIVLKDQKNFFGAIKKFENAATLCTDEMNDAKKICVNNAADCHYDLKNYDKTIALTIEALKIKSDTEVASEQDAFSMNLLGIVLKNQKKYSDAIKNFERAANMCSNRMNDKKKIYLNNQADCYFYLNNYDKTIELINAVLSIKSDTKIENEQDVFSMNLWGLILENQKNYKAAIEKYESAARLCTDEMNDEKKRNLNNQASCYHDMKNYVKAMEFIKTALKIKSDTEITIEQNSRSMNLWGHVLKNQNLYFWAIEKFKNASNLCTDEMNDIKKMYLNNQADCYHDIKKYDKAIELITAALNIKSNTEAANVQNVFSMNLWGHVLKDQKCFSAAIERYENLAKLCTDEMNDEKKMYLNNAANCYHDMKSFDKAIKLIKAALKIDSDTEDANIQNARSMNLWGCVLKDQKSYSAAIEKFENAARLCKDEMDDEKKIYLNNAADCLRVLKTLTKRSS